jgi:hypothetical protein
MDEVIYNVNTQPILNIDQNLEAVTSGHELLPTQIVSRSEMLFVPVVAVVGVGEIEEGNNAIIS